MRSSAEISFSQAALGAVLDVQTLDGVVKMRIPPGTQPGSVTTLRGHGMPHLRSGVRGDLHAHIDVVVPARLDQQDTELLRQLKTHRSRDVAEVKSTHAAAAGNGSIFSRLRETFSGR